MALRTSVVQTYLAQKVTERLSERFHADISVQGVDIAFFDKVVLEDVLIKDQQKDSMLRVGRLVAQIDSFSIRKHRLAIKKLNLNHTRICISRDSARMANYQFLLDSAFATTDTLEQSTPWRIRCSDFVFNDASFAYSDLFAEEKKQFQLFDVFLTISGFDLNQDSTSFRIDKLRLTDRKKFSLSNFSAHFLQKGDSLALSNLYAAMPHSVISRSSISVDKTVFRETGDYSQIKVDIQLGQSRIAMPDMGQLIPFLKGMDAEFQLSGHVYGTLADLKAKHLMLNYGENTSINCDFYMNGLPVIENTFVHFDLKKSTINFNDFRNFSLPNQLDHRYIDFPAFLYDAGLIEYQGSFTGFIGDFVAYGTVDSDFGELRTDLAFKPSGTDKLGIDGHLKTVDFRLGDFIGKDMLGRLTYNGEIKGEYSKAEHRFDARINGGIQRIDLNNYELKNIDLNGVISGQRFDGHLAVDDENLNFDFDGSFDFNQEEPAFDFEMNLNRANLIALNIDKYFQQSDLSFLLKANFKGDNIDNLSGFIWLEDGEYENENGKIGLNSFELRTSKTEEGNSLQLRSDYLDTDFQGNYKLKELPNSILKITSHFFPAANFKFDPTRSGNNFRFSGELKDFSKITEVLLPNFYCSPSFFSGNIDAEKNKLKLEADFARIEYNGTVFKNVSFDFVADQDLQLKSRYGEINYGDYQLYNIALMCDGKADDLKTQLSWNNYKEQTYSGLIQVDTHIGKTKADNFLLESRLLPSRIYISDSLWMVNPASLVLNNGELEVRNFSFSSEQQKIELDGFLSKDKNKHLNLKFEKINLDNLNNLLDAHLNIKGILSGEAAIFDPYQKAYFLSDIRIQNFSLRNHLFGDITMLNKWDADSEIIDSELKVNNGDRNTLEGKGFYSPQSSDLDFNFGVNGLSVTALQPFMEGSFTDFRGDAFGNVRVHGKPDHIQLDGDLLGKDAGLKLAFSQVAYNFSDTVRFAGDSIIFDHIKVFDEDGNTADFNGSIKHHNFEHMIYDLNFSTPRILAINTNSNDNERFYGKLYAGGNLAITGLGLFVKLDAAGYTGRGTDLNIMLNYEEQAKEYDFLRFVEHHFPGEPEEKKRTETPETSDLEMSFDIEATPDARVQLIYNSQVGDVIRSYGYGNLQIDVDKDLNMIMYGDYTVTRGDYLFTLQNIINKKFEIANGGTIAWNGDPYDATIDLKAVYHLKASLKELFPTSDNEIDYSQRVPVNCKIALSGNLNRPAIDFNIDLPSSEDRIKDEVQQFFNTEEDRNKQILSLLILGKFYTPEYLRGSYEASNTNVVGSTASELFSNQLSNWLSQISNDFDVGVNYRPGNQVTDDEVELALSTQIFNDRVTLNGNIGNNASQATSLSNNSDIVGDFDLSVKMNRTGKLQFKAFNHSNNTLIYETSPYTQGIGLSYREDYDNFKELWTKIKDLFRRKKK